MAETEHNFSDEELETVRNLLEPLDQPDIDRAFNPHLEQFQKDMEGLRPAAGTEEEGEVDFADVPSDFPPEEGASDLFAGGEEAELPSAEPFGETGPSESTDLTEGGELGETAEPPETSDLADFGDFGTEPETTPTAEAEPGAGEFDLGDLGDLGPTAGEPAEPEALDLGDLGGAETEPAEEAPAADLDLGDLDFGAPTSAEAVPEAADLGDLGDLGLGESPELAEAPADDLGLGDLGGGDLDFGAPTEPAAAAETPADLDFGDLGAEAETAPAGDLDLGGMDFEQEAATPTAAPEEDFLLEERPAAEPADTSFDLGADMAGLDAGPSLDMGATESSDLDLGAGDLDFSDLDATPEGGLDLGAETAVTAEPTELRPGPLAEDLSGDLGGDLLDSGDLSDMAEQAKMQSGIGDEFTDQDLANLRSNLNDYPTGIKKAVIDVVVNEKIERTDQRLLVNMVIEQASAEAIAGFLEERLGYRPDTTAASVTKDGVPIIYAEGMSPEDVARRRRQARVMVAAAAAGFVTLVGVFGVYYYLGQRSIQGLYEQGLEELTAARSAVGEERVARKNRGEEFFQKALNRAGGKYDVEYLNRYGIAYMQAGFHEEAFRKLFGEVTPPYGTLAGGQPDPATAWNRPGRRAPLVRPTDPARAFPAPAPSEKGGTVPEGRGAEFIDQDNRARRVEVAGAYLIDRLRDRELKRRTLINLARFHSQNARAFVESPEGDKFKNDGLAIDYYRLILTLMNLPNDSEAIAGIGQVHYGRGDFGAAAREYSKVIDKEPLEVSGHAGLLNTYIEIWAQKGKKDPRWVIAKHREIQKLGLEKKLPIYIMTKLAGFYVDLNDDDLRIVYQINPSDPVTGLQVRDNATRLLELIFRTEEQRDEETVVGSRYGEGFYQRGRYLLAQGEATRALQQFQNAHQYDPRHYLAVNDMGEYYKKQLDFTKARRYFEEARAIHDRYRGTYGARPEDETLMKGDVGKIYYNLGSLVFLRNAGVADPVTGGFPESRLYPARATEWTPEQRNRMRLLNEATGEFNKALELLKDERAKLETIYWLGWIDYTNGNFEKALERWSELDTLYEENYNDPVLLMARGNAYYYTDQLRAALGNYRKVLDDFERQALEVARPNPSDRAHSRLFLTLSAVSNNIGAVYEREYMETLTQTGDSNALVELEKMSLRHYFLAIDHARKVDYDNEIARTNQKLGFKYLEADRRTTGGQERRAPLIDDWVSPVLPSLRAPDTAERRRE